MKTGKTILGFSAILLIGTLLNTCGAFGGSVSMPSSIGFDVPSNMKMKMKSAIRQYAVGTTNAGPAYEQVLSFVDTGKTIVDSIDSIIGAVAANKDVLFTVKGMVIPMDSGAWLLFNSMPNVENAYYMYYGDSASKTNFYIDWQAVSSTSFKGKSLFNSYSTNDSFNRALIYYQNTEGNPSLDVYLDCAADSSLSSMRVKLEKLANLEVKVWAKAKMKKTSFPSGYDIIAYAKAENSGGAIAYAGGSTNFEILSVTRTLSNYVYKEFFDATGATLYRNATVTVSPAILGKTIINDPTGGIFTNNTAPSEVETILASMTILADSTFPTVTLP